jgi:lysophospholipase L1-like esterase
MGLRLFLLGLTLASSAACAWLAQHRSTDPVVLGRYSLSYAGLLAALGLAAVLALAAQFGRFHVWVHRWRGQVGLLVAMLVGVPLALELLVRWQDPLGISYYEEITRYGLEKEADPDLVYRHRPGWSTSYQGVPVHFNELGLRERPIPPREAGERRLLVLGDSVTFGWGVPVEETFPRLLEQTLARRAPGSVRVVNAGVGSYNTVQELAFLRRHGAAIDPDQVLLLYVNNDIEVQRVPFDPWSSATLAGHPPLDTVQILLGRSWLYRLGRHALRSTGDDERSAEELRAAPGWRASLEALTGIADWCEEHAAPLTVFFWRGPSSPMWEEVLFSDVVAVAQDAGVPVFDIAPFWSGANWRELTLSAVDSHPNARGHAILAEQMAERLHLGDALEPGR